VRTDKTVRLWDVATGRQIGPTMRHNEEVRGAPLTRDETRILSWSDDETAAVGRVLARPESHGDYRQPFSARSRPNGFNGPLWREDRRSNLPIRQVDSGTGLVFLNPAG
jgi:hypothetical protein